MSERRVSTRILSALLVLCMVLSMLPATAITAFAADSTAVTAATSVATIREYAAGLLKDNFSTAASEDSDSTSDKFSWDTEGKKTNWRYYNGVMLDALLMLGVDSDTDDMVSTDSALEFAKDFMDTNTEDADKAVTHYITKEVDSVPPALVLFDLLDTAEVTESDRAIYVKAINYVYEQLEEQTSYDACGGNFLHKMDNSSWSFWNIGLDGIYMAQPFLMEYANALAAGKITNTVNSKTATDIQKEVYDRLMWVADKMYDETTGLYHHGFTVEGGTYTYDDKEYEFDAMSGNGVFWGRGIGWYAAGLTLCIDLMPAGTYKNDLIAKLPKLFDGMIKYQDSDSGMWYNIVNTTDDVSSSNSNQLETSVSGLMSYAMMKAYNEGWVTDSKYAESAVAAFNGILDHSYSSGSIKYTYKSSGVGVVQSYYCNSSYETDEAKGVGGVLMAASEVDKYLGTAETFKTGAVVAPDITVALNGNPDYSGVKITLVGRQGTIKNVTSADPGVSFVEASTYALTTAGDVEVAVVYDESVIDTFTVTVVDSSVPVTGDGELSIEGEAAEAPSNPTFTEGEFVLVEEASEGSNTTTYTRVDSLVDGQSYVLGRDSGKKVAGNNLSEISATWTEADSVYTTTASVDLWTLKSTGDSDGSFYIYYNDGSNDNYLVDAGSNNITKSTTLGTDTTKWLFTYSNSAWNIQATNGTSDKKYLQVSDTVKLDGSAKTFWIFSQNAAGEATPAVYAKLTGSEGLVYTFGTASADIIADIQASTAFKVLVADNADGTDASEVEMSNSLVTITKNSDYKSDEAKTNNFIVKYDGVEIGTIPVTIYDDTSNTTDYTVSLSVTPGAVVASEGDTATTQLTATVTVEGMDEITYVVTYTSSNTSVAAVTESGEVTIVGKGSTTIVATLVSVTNGDTTYTSDDFGTITAEIPVTVNAAADDTHTHSYSGVETTAPTCTETGVMTYTCSCGATYTSTIAATGHSYTGEQTEDPTCTEKGTMTYTCSKCGDTYTAEVDALGHTEGEAVQENVKAATCVASGSYESVVYCSVCDAEISRTTVTVDATGEHTYVDGACSVCGAVDPATIDGNVQTTVTTGGTGTTYTHNFTKDGTTSTFYSFTSTATSTSYGTHTTPDGVESNTGLKIPKAVTIKFTAETSGTLTIVAVSASNDGSPLTINGTEYALLENKAATTITVELTAGSYEIGANTKDAYVFYISFEEDGTSGGTSTETKYKAVLTATPSSVSMTVGGDAVTLARSVSAVLAEDGTTAATVDQDSYTVTWTSGNSDVVTVDEDGKITAVGEGETTITGVIAKDSAMTVNDVAGTVLEDITVTIPVTVAAAAHTHSYTSSVTTEPGCETEGVRTYTCSCSDSYTEVIEATGHSYVNGVCSVCGEEDPDYEEPTTPEGTVTYVPATSIESGKEYLLIADNTASNPYAAKHATSNLCGSVEITYSNGIVYIASEDEASCLWTFTGSGSSYKITYTSDNTTYGFKSDATMTTGSIASATVTAIDASTGKYTVELSSNKELHYTSSGWDKDDSSGTTYYLYIYEKSSAPVYSVTVTPEKESMLTETTQTITASMLLGTDAVEDAEYTWSVTSGDATISGNGATATLTAGTTAGDVVISVTATSGENTATGTATVEITEPVTVSTAALNVSTLEVANGATVDTSSVKIVLTMSDGSTVELAGDDLTITGLPTDTTVAGTTTAKVSGEYDGTTYELDLSVVVAEAVSEGFMLDTSGSVNMNDGEYIIVAKSGDKYYALKAGTTTPVEVTITNGLVDITYADAEDIIWVFNETYIYNAANSKYLRNDSSPSKGGTGDKNSTVTVIDAATGAYAINLEGSGRYLYYNGSQFTRSSEGSEQAIYLYKWVTDKITPVSATLSTASVTVPFGGTVDLSGVTMEVTMSDGSVKTIENADLTYDTSSINTAAVGTYTVPVSYTENGKTVSVDLSVVVKNVSSGTTSDLWKHNFSTTADGQTDTDGFFTISGNYTSKTATYGDLSFDQALKMESSTKLSFDAPSEGTLTLVFNSDAKGKSVKINGTSYDVGTDGVLTVDVEAGEVTVTKGDTMNLFYVEYASALVDGITITNPSTMYIAANGGSLNPTQALEYIIRHNDATVTEGYTITWTSANEGVVTVDADGVLTAVAPGSTGVTAKVTLSDGTEYTATVPVTVVGPGVSSTEEMTLIVDEDGLNSAAIASTVYAGGVSATTYVLGYISSDTDVATVDENGNVTAVGAGTATIYTYIKSVNDITVYDGDGVTPQPAYFDSTVVTVSNKELLHAKLNSYDYVVQSNDSGSLADLLNQLIYKVSVTGAITDEEGVKLTLEYNTGSTDTVTFAEGFKETADGSQKYTSNGLTIDLSAVNTTRGNEGTYHAPITYTDDEGNVIFQDTLWIHVEEYDPSNYDGTLVKEDGVHYILHTGAFTEEDANMEYVIVAENADIAFKNPSETSTGSTTAAGAAVTRANGKVESLLHSGTYLYDGASVDYLTMSESDAYLSEWLLDTLVDSDTTDNVVQINMSNFLRYIGIGDSLTQLIHYSSEHVYLVTVDETTGECQIILGYDANNQPYYLGYVDGIWTATTETHSVYLYQKDIELDQDYSLDFDLYDKDYDLTKLPAAQSSVNLTENGIEIPDGFVYDSITPVIVWNNDNIINPANGDTYTIVWSSSDPSVATVDQNGKVTAVKEGTAVITATLYDVNGDTVICNTHQTEHMSKTVTVTVTSSTPVPVLTPSELTIGKGTMPNFNKVSVRMTFEGTNGEYDYDVPFDQLVFKLADATNEAGEVGFDNEVIGTYKVPVTYAGDEFTLTIHVVEDPYAGLDTAESIPGYPDAGSVRMQKYAEGVLDFTSTGVTMIELNAAGISTKSSVDVVLIVDVSNSMGWSMDWFSGMTDDQVADANDADKIPSNGASGTDKLDIAMQTATEFADILLNVAGGDNTLTFVTFAGADREHGGSSDNVDSVRTPMVGISDYATAASVFANTKFTKLEKDGTGAKYTLQIGGYSDDGYGEAQVSGTNRGNTNYDYAFGEAIDAIAQLKAKYEALYGESYESSGRQIHVVFMTDGAPSHYNNQRGNSSSSTTDTLWDGSGDKYTKLSNLSEANWLTYIKNYNEMATKLLPMIDGAYTVGFDMAHGGFGGYSYELADMQRVLEGLAKNTIVPTTMAENEQELDDYMTSLARALAYAGTNAKVTDKIGGNFSLFTGVNMYSSDIKDGIMTEAVYNEMAAMRFPITVYSYRLVVYSDIGSTLSVINTDGTVESVTITEDHLGLRVNEDPEILEQITFSADGTQAFSDVLGADVNIMTTTDGKRTIDAATFTYTATLDTMIVDEVEVLHAADEEIVWKIGNITDREVSMQYYAYLDGSLDNPREAVSGVYATNEYAYLEYVDVNGDYVKREFSVPQIAWGAANVTVRFYLVNEDGQFVNRAGVTFTNPANRLFLDSRAQYESELNNYVEFDAQEALVKAGLAADNVLFDTSVHVKVTNSTDVDNTEDGVNFSSGTAKDMGLLFYTDTTGGYYSNVIIDIPVVLTDLGASDQAMITKSVVIDYGKEIVFDPFDATVEAPYKNMEVNGVLYQMSVVGFANYNADHDLKDYIPATGYVATLNTANGTYKVSEGNVSFTPLRMLSEVDKVFVAIKFSTSVNGVATPQNDYYMYKLVNIIPATSVYYETDFATNVFTLTGNWDTVNSGNAKDGPQDFVEIGADNCYGYDSTYTNDNGYSNYSSLSTTGTALSDGQFTTKATFSFTGTGFDIISRTGANEGAIVVTITQNGTVYKKITVINKGENELYQIPVISVEDIPYGTYTVEIGVSPAVSYPDILAHLNRGGSFYFDAIRVYNPAQGNTEAEAAYEKDNEANTSIFEIRGLLVNPVDTSIAVEGVSFIDKQTVNEDGTTTNKATITDYAAIGPNNELYIDGNSAIAFAITWTGSAPTSIDIGAKSIISNQSANLKAYISGNAARPVDPIKNVAITSATAQFYELVNMDNAADFSAVKTAYVFIENTGTGVLSLTDIKVAFGDSAAITSIDFSVDQGVLDFANACATFGDEDEDASTEETESVITQKGRTLSYEDLIYVIDIFELYGVEGIDLTKDAGLMVWSVEEYEALNGQLVFNEANANVGLVPYADKENLYYGVSDGIFTRDLHEKAYYAGYVKLEDNTYIFSEAKLYSPATYAYNMLAKAETSDVTKNLCVALLNYISAAQKYFHNTADADLVNADLTAEQKALTWNDPELNLASQVPAEKNVDRDSEVFTATGKNLLFEEMISLVSIYKIDSSIVASAAECGTIFWTAEQFAALEGAPSLNNMGEGIKTGLIKYMGKDGQWASIAPAVAPKDMADTEYFILGYVVHADGTVSYSGVVSYTFEQYINNMADSAAMGEFAMRLYYYERAAKAALG